MSLTAYPNGVSSFGIPQVGHGIPVTFKNYWFVDAASTSNLPTGKAPNKAFTTLTAALTTANAGDCILVAPGSYDEAITVSSNKIAIVGTGGRGSVYVAPAASNATAITVSSDDVALINIGGEGNGTGGGIKLSGDVDRFRAYGCKFEGGTTALHITSTASGAPADNRFIDCEFAWATNGVHITVSGGGDPCTQTLFDKCLFHNIVTDVIKTSTSHTADLWVTNSIFANQEDGTQPTRFLDIDEANTTGFIANNLFATTVFSTAKFAIAAGVIFANNISQAENPSANVGGTAGRPD